MIPGLTGLTPLPPLPATAVSSPGEGELPVDTALHVLPSPVKPCIVNLASAHGIPVVEVKVLSAPATLAALETYRPEVICVACFPRIFPRALLAIPPLGCLNLHPSLLPAYRGPAPLFWQFRQGESRTGVTVHFMDEGADTGDIALQSAVAFPDGISGAEADRICSQAGAALMVQAIDLLQRGACPRRSQPEAGSSYFTWPARADFEISTGWSARRAYNFIRGTEEWGVLFEIPVRDGRIEVHRAISFSPDEILGESWRFVREEVWVQFAEGVLRVQGTIQR
jgi:methionyl-tRNA formyltransferase